MDTHLWSPNHNTTHTHAYGSTHVVSVNLYPGAAVVAAAAATHLVVRSAPVRRTDRSRARTLTAQLARVRVYNYIRYIRAPAAGRMFAFCDAGMAHLRTIGVPTDQVPLFCTAISNAYVGTAIWSLT